MIVCKVFFLGLFAWCMFETPYCHPAYRDTIPNGRNVPNPCTNKTDDTWGRVGHMKLSDSSNKNVSEKNMFGVGFNTLVKNGPTDWNKLCKSDSDGDGRSNGVELGDPRCVWDGNSTPDVTNITLLSHPGIPDYFDNNDILQVKETDKQTFCTNNN